MIGITVLEIVDMKLEAILDDEDAFISSQAGDNVVEIQYYIREEIKKLKADNKKTVQNVWDLKMDLESMAKDLDNQTVTKHGDKLAEWLTLMNGILEAIHEFKDNYHRRTGKLYDEEDENGEEDE